MIQAMASAMDTESLTSILGWVSIACWIVVYSPQIYENYSLKSGEGLSVLFVVVWLVGDLCNLVGAVLADLLNTVIILALYYSLCDIILLCQVYYYRWLEYSVDSERTSKKPSTPGSSSGPASESSSLTRTRTRRRSTSPSTPPSETQPLLSAPHPPQARQEPPQHPSRALDDDESPRKVLLRYTLALVFVCLTGVVAWYVSEKFGDKTAPIPPKKQHSRTPEWVIQSLGWGSAVMYLGARIPQILKNIQTHCTGLSPALFFFAIIGNLTYALSIVVASTGMEDSEARWRYLVRNAGWLAGSALTVFLDFIVLGQFFYYRSKRFQPESSSSNLESVP